MCDVSWQSALAAVFPLIKILEFSVGGYRDSKPMYSFNVIEAFCACPICVLLIQANLHPSYIKFFISMEDLLVLLLYNFMTLDKKFI